MSSDITHELLPLMWNNVQEDFMTRIRKVMKGRVGSESVRLNQSSLGS